MQAPIGRYVKCQPPPAGPALYARGMSGGVVIIFRFGGSLDRPPDVASASGPLRFDISDSACSLLRAMQRHAIVSDAITYCAVVGACDKGLQQKGL